MAQIKTLLIANRGEVALRIMATCQTLGVKTIVIYSEEDQHSSYVFAANEAYKLSGSGAQAYLNQDEIIEIAKHASANAIHPGYGFLAENAQFAQKIIDAKLIWVGPRPECIAMMADKSEAQKIMCEAGVPTIPTTQNDFPLIIKCAHGGGGKAMRIVREQKDFERAWNAVASEAQTLFNSQTILVEKYIESGRHIEIQIAGDGTNFIHLYERDCSLQRRQQKIIEETPCKSLRKQTKEKLYKYAIQAAQAVNYNSIGTVEFLVDAKENIYFLEMNTRLQVEHSVTEMTTGIDLVGLQITLAMRKLLPYNQNEISQRGHAIECRIYSENPKLNFLPATGTITNLTFPNNPFIRIDHDLESLTEITPLFDPMIAKISVYGENRQAANNLMLSTLAQTNISGITTNIDFLQSIIKSNFFVHGQFHTQTLQNKTTINELVNTNHKHNETVIEIAKHALKLFKQQLVNNNGKQKSKTIIFEYIGQRHKAKLISATTYQAQIYLFGINETVTLQLKCKAESGTDKEATTAAISSIESPLSGRVITIHVKTGQEVKKGQPLVTIESMKMENEILSPASLFIKSIHIDIGHLVQQGHVLLETEPIETWGNGNESNRKTNEQKEI